MAVIVAAFTQLSVSSGARAVVGPPEGLGPRGETPLAGVSDADIAAYAKGSGVSIDDVAWLMRYGTKILGDFHQARIKDPRYGAVWTTNDPFRVHLRITRDAPDLVADLSRQLGGRPLDVRIQGESYGYLAVQHDDVSRRMIDVEPIMVSLDHELGLVTLETNVRNAQVIASKHLPSDVRVLLTDFEAASASSFAGADFTQNCTVGYAARRNSDNFRGVVTAGHCNANGSSYGFTLWPQEQQTCTDTDRQVHPTTANYIWYGFYGFSGQWTNIAAVAGGWYPNQPFFRRGVNTVAGGNISDITTISVSGGDCGSYQSRGFVLYNSVGSNAVLGDSGGPLMLAYSGQWYLAGTTSAQGIPNGPSGGFAVWRSIPAGWTACTAANPSCAG